MEGLFALKDTELTSKRAGATSMRTPRAAYDEFCNRSTDERRAFARYLVDGVCMIIVSTDDLAGAHRIFNVMNVRGLPLTRAGHAQGQGHLIVTARRSRRTTVNVGTTPSTCWENRRNHSSIR